MMNVFPESSGYKIFENDSADKIELDDIMQGALGDCWVLSSMSALAEIPSRVYNLFGTKKRNKAGIYVINLYDLGVPTAVVVDDYIPTSWDDDGMYVHTNGTEKEIWTVLLEKAFAKLNGNYASIIAGDPSMSAYHFLGISGSYISSSETSAD